MPHPHHTELRLVVRRTGLTALAVRGGHTTWLYASASLATLGPMVTGLLRGTRATELCVVRRGGASDAFVAEVLAVARSHPVPTRFEVERPDGR